MALTTSPRECDVITALDVFLQDDLDPELPRRWLRISEWTVAPIGGIEHDQPGWEKDCFDMCLYLVR